VLLYVVMEVSVCCEKVGMMYGVIQVVVWGERFGPLFGNNTRY
jgi:hypothetical protein